VANWRKTRWPGVFVAHQRSCPAEIDETGRCRCTPSFRGRRRNPATGATEWQQPVTKDRNEVLAWLGASRAAAPSVRAAARRARTFESLGDEWIAAVEAHRISRRRGRGKPYSDTTIADYARSYRNFLRPAFGSVIADELDERAWQQWIDQCSGAGLSRLRIAGHVAVASAIYAWALAPMRRYLTHNPLRHVDLPPNDERPRLRVAPAAEAAALLDALDAHDRVPYAIAFYAGLRRAEIHRLEWPDVLAPNGIGSRVLVQRAKSAAGMRRRPPIAAPLRTVLDDAWNRQGRPSSGRVLERSVMSGKLTSRARQAWHARGLQPITLHECRHTYASLLMAAGYTLKELMEFMGHADLQMVARYVKLLPQPGEDDAAERLDAYLRRATTELGDGSTT
jgi:integrase